MKRVLYLVVLLALAGGFYVYAYPRLAGVGQADAQQAAAPTGKGVKSFAVSVVSAVARKQTVPITRSAVGYMEPTQTVAVRSRADGTVIETDVVEGQSVKVGDVLFRLDDSGQQATVAKDQAQILKDQANAKASQATLERDRDLIKSQVIPQSTMDADMAAADAAAATVKVDQAQLRADQVSLSYMTITAPIAGRVGTVNTSVGNVVHAADTSTNGLLTITQMSPLRVSFTVAESALDSFRQAMATGKPVPVDISAPDDTSPRARGTLSFIDSSVDTASGTVVLKADVDNSKGLLWPGQYVTTKTQLGAYDDATTVPLVAVQQSDAGAFVYLVEKGGKVKQQPVQLVAAVDDTAVIGRGINPGDHVITEGQLRVATGSTVRETIEGQAADVASGVMPATGAGAPSSGTEPAKAKS